jgi:cysteine desulfurase
MEKDILTALKGVSVVGAVAERVSNTSNFVFQDVSGESLLMSLDVKGFSVSSGSACSSGSPEPSPVLLAMGCSHREAQSSLRVSLGWTTTEEEVQSFVKTLIEIITYLREVNAGQMRV